MFRAFLGLDHFFLKICPATINKSAMHPFGSVSGSGFIWFQEICRLAVLARNIPILGAKIQRKEQKRLRRKEKEALKWDRQAA
jgi:hypothetical protein